MTRYLTNWSQDGPPLARPQTIAESLTELAGFRCAMISIGVPRNDHLRAMAVVAGASRPAPDILGTVTPIEQAELGQGRQLGHHQVRAGGAAHPTRPSTAGSLPTSKRSIPDAWPRWTC